MDLPTFQCVTVKSHPRDQGIRLYIGHLQFARMHKEWGDFAFSSYHEVTAGDAQQ